MGRELNFANNVVALRDNAKTGCGGCSGKFANCRNTKADLDPQGCLHSYAPQAVRLLSVFKLFQNI